MAPFEAAAPLEPTPPVVVLVSQLALLCEGCFHYAIAKPCLADWRAIYISLNASWCDANKRSDLLLEDF
jgi:hypothetical protein